MNGEKIGPVSCNFTLSIEILNYVYNSVQPLALVFILEK